ncbi:MAG: hypothetical protein INR72_16230 [Williamsia herbipolensis]|nr:hypothetical protein [Williamsia herbipolensis]
MTFLETTPAPSRYRHYPREVAAAVTLRAGAAALVASAPRPSDTAAITTACGALATRLALIAFVARVDRPDPRSIVAFDPYTDRLPSALHGVGPAPDRDRIRLAGDRCVDAWRRWRAGDVPTASPHGVAGALAVAAWCSWALGSEARAMTRARHATDVRPDDPLADLVHRTCRARVAPSWDR